MKRQYIGLSQNALEADNELSLKEEVEKHFYRLSPGMQKVIQHIWDNYDKPLYAKLLAEEAGFKNDSYFGKAFKKSMGCSYVHFINGIRIKIAKEKLANTNYSIDDIAKQVGFNDISSFHRVFKTFEKKSPSRYRKDLISKIAIRIPLGKRIDLLENVLST